MFGSNSIFSLEIELLTTRTHGHQRYEQVKRELSSRIATADKELDHTKQELIKIKELQTLKRELNEMELEDINSRAVMVYEKKQQRYNLLKQKLDNILKTQETLTQQQQELFNRLFVFTSSKLTDTEIGTKKLLD